MNRSRQLTKSQNLSDPLHLSPFFELQSIFSTVSKDKNNPPNMNLVEYSTTYNFLKLSLCLSVPSSASLMNSEVSNSSPDSVILGSLDAEANELGHSMTSLLLRLAGKLNNWHLRSSLPGASRNVRPELFFSEREEWGRHPDWCLEWGPEVTWTSLNDGEAPRDAFGDLHPGPQVKLHTANAVCSPAFPSCSNWT